jgi:DNA-directed RNA polymerase sigma subunit (sigma70/sigma32)
VEATLQQDLSAVCSNCEVLTPRARIIMRFGLGESEHTLEQIGKQFDNRERIRQLSKWRWRSCAAAAVMRLEGLLTN